MQKLNILLGIAILIVFSQCASYKVYHVDKNFKQSRMNGIYYSLPKTVVNVEVTVNKTQNFKGPYAQYAAKYLGLTNILMNNNVSYEISNVDLTTSFVPDNNNLYFIKIPKCSKKFIRHKELMINLCENGIITGVNEYKSLNSKSIKRKVFFKRDNENDIHNLAITENLQVKYDTTLEKISVDTMIIQQKKVKKFIVEKTDEDKAKEASEMIAKLKNSKTPLMIGESEVPYPAGTIDRMFDEINKQQQEYIELFTGYSVTSPMKFSFSFIPDSSSLKKENLICRFSDESGIRPKQDTIGNKISLVFEKSNCSLVNNNIENFFTGFTYIIPDLSKIIIKLDNEVLKQSSNLISQYGNISNLSRHKKKLKIQYYKNTGAIKSLSY